MASTAPASQAPELKIQLLGRFRGQIASGTIPGAAPTRSPARRMGPEDDRQAIILVPLETVWPSATTTTPSTKSAAKTASCIII